MYFSIDTHLLLLVDTIAHPLLQNVLLSYVSYALQLQKRVMRKLRKWGWPQSCCIFFIISLINPLLGSETRFVLLSELIKLQGVCRRCSEEARTSPRSTEKIFNS